MKDEQHALRRLLERHGNHIVALAKDIAVNGLDPLQSWAVVKEGTHFVVIEGNRRLVACRLLLEPDKAPSAMWAKKFRSISVTAPLETVRKASCVVFDRRSDARHWIKLRHHGVGNGEGTAPWGPEMVYLDGVNHGGTRQPWNEFWYWLEDGYAGHPDVMALIESAREAQYTTMERVFNWALQDLLGACQAPDGRLDVPVDKEKIELFVRALMTGMSTKEATFTIARVSEELKAINSRTALDAGTTEALIQETWKHTIGTSDILLDDSPGVPGTGEDEPEDEGAATSDQSDSRNEDGDGSPADKPKPNNRTRRKLKSETNLYAGITSRTGLPGRLKDLLIEASGIVIDEAPETAAVMARVAVELTTDALIEARSIEVKSKKNEATLAEKLKAVLGYLDPQFAGNMRVSRPELSGTWAAIRGDLADKGHMIRDLNDCVHAYEFTAALDIARRANRNLTPLMKEMVADLLRD